MPLSNFKITIFSSLLGISIFLSACCTTSLNRPLSTSTSVATVLADDRLNAVVWAQTSVEHDLVYRAIYRNGQEKLLKALSDPNWDALPHEERKNAIANLKPAVILDVDETVLDNSPLEARLIKNGKEFDAAAWEQWCQEAKAKPLPGALEFTQFAAYHGVTVFYVTNRAQKLADATLKNLRQQGFPVADNETVFLGAGFDVPACKPIGSSKGCRRELIGRNYRVLMEFGDQLGDFVDIANNTPQGRIEAAKPYADWVGERWFMLPNAMYGSWESAFYPKDAPQPVRQQAKRDALHSD